MAYTIKSFIYNRYARLYYLKNKKNFDEFEELFMIKFASVEFDFGSKRLYYNAVYRMKKWYPKMLIYLLVLLEFYVYFKKNNASKDLINSIPIFSKLLLCDATRGYCRPYYKYEK